MWHCRKNYKRYKFNCFISKTISLKEPVAWEPTIFDVVYFYFQKVQTYVCYRSHHNKKSQLQALKKIAKERNPDEFYIGMTKTKLVNGVHFDINSNEGSLLTPAQRLLIKTGNTNYIRLKIQQEKKVWYSNSCVNLSFISINFNNYRFYVIVIYMILITKMEVN